MNASTPDGERRWRAPAALILLGLTLGVAGDAAPAALAGWILPAYATLLVLAPAVLYPWLRCRRVSIAAAAAVALVPALLWTARECRAVAAIFGVGPAAYYAFNPLSVGLYVAAAVQMATAELALRRIATGRWQLANRAGLILLGAAVLATAVAAAAVRRDATVVFWLYIDLYRRLFAG